jgi:hypothetical protein
MYRRVYAVCTYGLSSVSCSVPDPFLNIWIQGPPFLLLYGSKGNEPADVLYTMNVNLLAPTFAVRISSESLDPYPRGSTSGLPAGSGPHLAETLMQWYNRVL